MCPCNISEISEGELSRAMERLEGVLNFRVGDMSCGHCATTITRAIEAAMPGASVDVDLASKIVRVHGADDHAGLQRIIAEAGYQAAPV